MVGPAGEVSRVLGSASKGAGACQLGTPSTTIIYAKSQCQKERLEQEPWQLCSKESEGAGCECQGTLGFHGY